jgi:hypothetical protein
MTQHTSLRYFEIVFSQAQGIPRGVATPFAVGLFEEGKEARKVGPRD